MYDLVINEMGRHRYNEMLKDAEQERNAARVRQREGLTRMQQSMLRLSHLFMSTGTWLKHRAEAHPSMG